MKRGLVFATTVLALLIPMCLTASAQVDVGSILVKAVDEQEGLLAGVTVTIASPAIVAGQTVGVTDARGTRRFSPLLPGIYSVKVELPGFQAVLRENIVVSVGQTTPIELVLQRADVKETVVVRGDSPVVDTTSANVHTTVTKEIMRDTPGGRDVWSLLEAKVPGLVTSRPDVSGAAAGLQASASARGTAPSENLHFLNGLNVGSSSSLGGSPFYHDFDALEEVQVSVAAHDLSIPSAGVVLNMRTKTGTDRYQGGGSLNWQGDKSQTTNVDQELARYGFREDAGATDLLLDGSVQFGGPIIKERLRFFTSVRDWRANVSEPGYPVLETTNITTAMGSLGWQLNPRNNLTGYANQQWYRKPHRGAGPTETPDTTANETLRLWAYQASWNSVFSDRAYMDLRANLSEHNSRFGQRGTAQTLLDASTGNRTRSRAVEQHTIGPRLHANANLHYYVNEALAGRHEIRLGFDYVRKGPVERGQVRIDDLELTYRSQPVPTASTVRLWNSPVFSKQLATETSLYVQDRYSVGRLTLIGGARLEWAEGSLPAQESPQSRWFPGAQRRFEAVRNVPSWRGVAPRLSMVYAFSDKTALKASAGRYLYALHATGLALDINPNFNASETYAWNDLNGDLVFQPAERGNLLSRSGGVLTAIDPDLKQPYTNELTFGMDRELIPGVRLSASFNYREERNLYGSTNVGIPSTAYRLVGMTDLGRDGLENSGDEGTVFVWDQDRATLGQDFFNITNSDALNRTYKGFEVTASKRFSGRWQMLAGYTLSRAVANATSINNPNSLVNSQGVTSFDRPHIFKLSGTYILPYNVALSGNARTQSGAPQQRTATYRLTQGNVSVNVEPPGAVRLDPMTLVDARVAKKFRLQGQQVELLLDAYNLLNVNTPWSVRTLTGRVNLREGGVPSGALVNQQQFLSPTAILSPRVIRLGVTYSF